MKIEIGPVVLKRGFLNIFNIILLLRNYHPLEKGMASLELSAQVN